MKKLMIAVAVTLAGVAANAAYCNWTTTSMSALGDAASCSASALGKKDVQMFIWEFSAEDWTALKGRYTNTQNIWDDFKAGTLDAGDAYIKAGTTASPNPKVAGGKSWSEGDSVYAAILYLHEDPPTSGSPTFTADSATAYMANYAMGTASNAGSAVGNIGNTLGVNITTGSSTSWQSVPEPTSGLLLLIGVAGLALRRRRA